MEDPPPGGWWVQVPRAWLTDDRLSWRALGQLVWLLSLPAGAITSALGRLDDAGPDGHDASRTALAELYATGYVDRSRTRDAQGHIRWTHTLTSPDMSLGWVRVPQALIQDQRLPWRTRALLAWLAARPPGWTPRPDHLATVRVEGRDAVRAALDVAYRVGYLVRGRGPAVAGRAPWIHALVLDQGRPPARPGPRRTAPAQRPAPDRPADTVPAARTAPTRRAGPPRPRRTGTDPAQTRTPDPTGTDGHPTHPHHDHTTRACLTLHATGRLPLRPETLVAWSYRHGAGDPWAGYLTVRDACARALDDAHDPARVLSWRLRQATPAAPTPRPAPDRPAAATPAASTDRPDPATPAAPGRTDPSPRTATPDHVALMRAAIRAPRTDPAATATTADPDRTDPSPRPAPDRPDPATPAAPGRTDDARTATADHVALMRAATGSPR